MSEGPVFVGIGTPQANPTVELEFRRMLHEPVSTQVTRLTSRADTPSQRLREYLLQLPAALASYDTLPLSAFAFACTGSSYLLGADAESQLLDHLEQEKGFAVITATQAIARELRIRKVRNLSIFAPYPEDLCASAVEYWTGLGYEVMASGRIPIGQDTRAIYELTDPQVEQALARFDHGNPDVLLLSGTGMPTITALQHARFPTISSNLCLAAEVMRRLGRWPADQPASVTALLENKKDQASA
ncbi:MAG: hypothetical protein QNJ40_24100 [Xanthomonadales bacterium]|nr:hypothetical protein [Xanthomonadales bacterium]